MALLAVLVIGFQMPGRMMPYVESPIGAVAAEERMADVAGLVRGATSGTLRTQ